MKPTTPRPDAKTYTCAVGFTLSKTHNQPAKAPYTWEITFDFTVPEEPANPKRVKCKE